MFTIALYVGVIVSVGVFIGILVRAFQRVQKKSVEQGVVYSDGIQSDEAKLIARLVEEELREQHVLEDAKKALAIAQRLATKLTKQVGTGV